MSPLHLQELLGHSTLEMTRRYIQMISDNLVDAHREPGRLDRFVKQIIYVNFTTDDFANAHHQT
jgi:integrase